MRLAASQIAWDAGQEEDALLVLREAGFTGLEIAPPRVAGPQPYSQPWLAAEYAARVRRAAGLSLCSMQSIWFGQSGSLFGPEREALRAYTEKAVLFAEAAGIANLVFGNPKNRVKPEGAPEEAADSFFREIGAFAARHGAVIALEPNPPLYGTNFMNTTAEALATAERVNSPGVMVNLDFGAIVANGEDVAALAGRIGQLRHVHISEPELVMLKRRPAHRTLSALLREAGYTGWVSIEMKQQSLENLRRAAAYVAEVFG